MVSQELSKTMQLFQYYTTCRTWNSECLATDQRWQQQQQSPVAVTSYIQTYADELLTVHQPICPTTGDATKTTRTCNRFLFQACL